MHTCWIYCSNVYRSGETSDSTIADLAVAMKTCQIKTGSHQVIECLNTIIVG